MRLYRTRQGAMVERAGRWHHLAHADWDAMLGRDDLPAWLDQTLDKAQPIQPELHDDGTPADVLAPILSQEVWACGVTYYRSRDARMAESAKAGGDTFYDRVYTAPRPEIFFKATPHRTAGHRQPVRIRGDSQWNVPEPELTLLVTPGGRIVGYTVGNDMSSRDIEGENPLYLPQAKVYDQSCALGPGILVADEPLPPATPIRMEIRRDGQTVFHGQIDLTQLKRDPADLVQYLFRDNSFPRGCFVLTGTGIIPDDSFTLHHGDEIRITIDPIGTLVNPVA